MREGKRESASVDIWLGAGSEPRRGMSGEDGIIDVVVGGEVAKIIEVEDGTGDICLDGGEAWESEKAVCWGKEKQQG